MTAQHNPRNGTRLEVGIQEDHNKRMDPIPDLTVFTKSFFVNRIVKEVACGRSFALCLTVGGSVYGWGENSCGQTGQVRITHEQRPMLIKFNGEGSSCILSFDD